MRKSFEVEAENISLRLWKIFFPAQFLFLSTQKNIFRWAQKYFGDETKEKVRLIKAPT
jgi:hypothetical protein